MILSPGSGKCGVERSSPVVTVWKYGTTWYRSFTAIREFALFLLCVIVKVMGSYWPTVTAPEQSWTSELCHGGGSSKADLRIYGILGSSVITNWWKPVTRLHSESSPSGLSHSSAVWHWFKSALLWSPGSAGQEQRLFSRVRWGSEKVSVTFWRICGCICWESASKSVQEDHMSAQEFTAMVLKIKLNVARGLYLKLEPFLCTLTSCTSSEWQNCICSGTLMPAVL